MSEWKTGMRTLLGEMVSRKEAEARIATLESRLALAEELARAVMALPVEEIVRSYPEEQPDGNVIQQQELLGYAMQCTSEWETVCKAAAAFEHSVEGQG